MKRWGERHENASSFARAEPEEPLAVDVVVDTHEEVAAVGRFVAVARDR
jgi:hypothetical protein